MKRCLIIFLIVVLVPILGIISVAETKDQITENPASNSEVRKKIHEKWTERLKEIRGDYEKINEMETELYKEMIDYAKLPGKGGKLCSNFKFNKDDYDILKEYIFSDSGFEPVLQQNKLLLKHDVSLSFKKDNINKGIRLIIIVSIDSVDAAQEALLRQIKESSLPIEMWPGTTNLNIGGENYLNGFVRNNIAVYFNYTYQVDEKLVSPSDARWLKEYPIIELAKK